MKKTFKGVLALAFCIVTVFATMIIAAAVDAPKAKVKAVTYNTATISWAAVKGADGGYEIQRSTSSKSGFKTIATTTSTSYKDSKLTTGKTYYYRVRAVDKTLFGKRYSSWTSVVKAKPVPSKVTGVKASPNYNSIKLTWSKVSGASGYEIQVYSSKKWKAYKTASKNTITISKLKLGTTYQYRIRAYKTVSKKKVYGDFSSTIKATPTLKAPSSFVLKGVSTSSLTLSWSAVDGAKGYEVYNASTKKWTNTKTKRSLTVKKLKAGTKYGFIVRAYSGKYDGTKTKTLSFYTTPSAPSGLKVSKAAATTLDVSWSKVTGAAGYQVQYSTDGKKWTSLSGTTKTTATIKSLKSATKYYVRVRAYVKNSNVKDISATSYGAYSSKLTAYTNVVAPKTISLSKATTTSLSITWSSSTGATKYEYYNPVTKKWVSTGTSRSATISGLKAGTKYSLKVRATGNSKNAVESSSVSFTTAPAAVTGLKCNSTTIGGVIISDATTNSFTVTWSKVTGAAGYRVQHSADGKTWTNLTTSSTTATIKSLKADTAYTVKVSAYVKNSSATTYGTEAVAVVKTLSTAKAAVTATAESSTDIRLSWTEISGATGYVIEKFSTTYKDWIPYNFTAKTWEPYEDFSSEEKITTAETTFVDTSRTSARNDLYRVRVVDANSYLCYPSEIASGHTADISIKSDAYTTELEFMGEEGAKSINVHTIYPYSTSEVSVIESGFTYSNGKYKVKISLAPNSIQSFLIVARGSNGMSKGSTGSIVLKTQPLKAITSSSDSNYNASVNSHLLYLTHAINNTKTYTDKITVKLASSITTNCGELEVYRNGERKPLWEAALGLLMGDELSKDIQESNNYTYTFTDGKAKDSSNIAVQLRSFLEPNSNAYKYAYLHNGSNPDAWKNGISNFTSSLSNGRLTVSFKLKKEANDPLYHNGFLSVLNSKSLSQEGLSTEEVVVGESTVKATVSSDYILESYSAVAPFTGKFSMSMTATEDSNEDGITIEKGDNILFKIPITGNSNFTYTFTR